MRESLFRKAEMQTLSRSSVPPPNLQCWIAQGNHYIAPQPVGESLGSAAAQQRAATVALTGEAGEATRQHRSSGFALRLRDALNLRHLPI